MHSQFAGVLVLIRLIQLLIERGWDIQCCIVCSEDNEEANPQEVLLAIRDYIQYFFGCRQCAQNFAQKTVTIQHDVTKPEDGIMWLWNVHNQVGCR